MQITIINLLLVIILGIIMLYHSYMFRGACDTFIFAIVSGGIGILVEYVGVSSGGYGYTGQNTFMVSLFTFFGWIANTYMAMHLTKIILQIQNDKINSLKNSLKLGLATGAIGVTYDLFTDPVDTALKVWTWSYEGFWFGVPTSNFIGWFLILSSAVIAYNLTSHYGKTLKQKIVLSTVLTVVGSFIVILALKCFWILGIR